MVRHKKLMDDMRKDQEKAAGLYEKQLVAIQKQFSQRTEKAIKGLKSSPLVRLLLNNIFKPC